MVRRAARFLPGRSRRRTGAIELLRRRAAQGLDDDPQAGFVVHGRRTGEVVAHLGEPKLERHRIADFHKGRGVGLVLGADIEPQVAELGHLISLFVGEQVDRLAAIAPKIGPLAVQTASF